MSCLVYMDILVKIDDLLVLVFSGLCSKILMLVNVQLSLKFYLFTQSAEHDSH